MRKEKHSSEGFREELLRSAHHPHGPRAQVEAHAQLAQSPGSQAHTTRCEAIRDS